MKSEYNKGPSKLTLMLGGSGDPHTDEPEPHTIVWLSTHSNSRNKGHARALLDIVLADADRDLILHLNPDRGIERERLRKLFESVGFVNDKDKPDNMTWTYKE